MKTFEVKTPQREVLVDITHRVAAVLPEDAGDGLCVVFIPHTTAGVTINENADPDVCLDLMSYLAETVPRGRRYRHAEGNSDAHIKATLLGSSAQIPVVRGRMALGTWQGVYLGEFDGPRTRTVRVMFLRTDTEGQA